MRRLRSILGGERGQGLVLAAFALMVILGFAAIVLDVGLAYAERQKLQNATDAAALAAAQDLVKGESKQTAIATAIDYMARHGFDVSKQDIKVNMPPLKGKHIGDANYIEVAASSESPMVFLGLFRDDAYTVQARSVAEYQLGSEEGGGDECEGKKKKECEEGGKPEPAPVPTVDCGSPTVDGRVTTSDDYTKLGDLFGGSTDYGDVFYGCDDAYMFFAMRLNGPSTGGAVANENVYGDDEDYHEAFQTEWEDAHTFGKLKGSDRARFQIACDDEARHDFVQDYLRNEGKKGDEVMNWVSDALGDGEAIEDGPAESASSLEWNLEHPEESGWGDDPGEDPLEQSPPFDPLYPTYDSEYDGWVWEMLYEFKVSKAAYDDCSGPVYFGLHNFAGESGPLEGIHSSPAKVEGAEYLVIREGRIRLVE